MALAMQAVRSAGLKLNNLKSLVHAATLAPSGDNTQPWAFEIDPDRPAIRITTDARRDPSPMNAGQRMARIAVGAAGENVMHVAEASGIGATFRASATDVEIVFDSAIETVPVNICAEVKARCTNRNFFDGSLPDQATCARIRRFEADAAGVRLVWVTERERLQDWARFIGRSDEAMFGLSAVRRAFLNNIRFDLPLGRSVDEGLGLATLAANRFERSGLRLMHRLPEWALRLMRPQAQIGQKSKRLVARSAGLCVGVTADNSPENDFHVGRMMEQAWLTLTTEGFAVQPMMSAAVLDNLSHHGDDQLRAIAAAKVNQLERPALDANEGPGRERLAFLLRFGRCNRSAARSGRRSPSVLRTSES